MPSQTTKYPGEPFEKTTEDWKPVLGLEGVYEVSNHGRVRRVLYNYRSAPNGMLKPWLHSQGYLCVDLYENGKYVRWFVHRLVASVFIGPCPDNREVNHKDGNKTNNAVDNLEYVTRNANVLHSYHVIGHIRPNIRGEANPNSKLTKGDVLHVRKLLTSGVSDSEIARMYGVNSGTIRRIRIGKSWSDVP